MKKVKLPKLLLLLLIVIILGGGVFYLFKNKKSDFVSYVETEDISIPTFSDYINNEGSDGSVLEKTVPVDIDSHPKAKEHEEQLKYSATFGPDFNYKYKIVTFSCGAECQYYAVIDLSNGQVFFPDIGSNLGVEYHTHSSLFIANPPINIYERIKSADNAGIRTISGKNPYVGSSTQFYIWENGGFKLIKDLVITYNISNNLQTNGDSIQDNELSQDDFDDVPHQVSNLNGVEILEPNFDDLAVSSSNKFINQVIQLKGKISNLSRIDGIKFWPYDEKLMNGQRSEKEFFWATPEGIINPDQHHGNWVEYTLKRYAGLSPEEVNAEKDVYLVTGKYTGSDCDYWKESPDLKKFYCIPQIEILEIERLSGSEINNFVTTETDPLKIIECDYEPEIHYWYDKDLSSEGNYDKRQENFYITCGQIGTAHILSVYIFRDYKLIFNQNLYRGRFFKETAGNNFYTITGIFNPEANAYPFGYRLMKYSYNSKTNSMDLTESKEYQSAEAIQKLYEFEKNNNLNFGNNPDGSNFYSDTISNIK